MVFELHPIFRKMVACFMLLFALSSAFAQDRMIPMKITVESVMEHQHRVMKFFDVYCSRCFNYVVMPSFSEEYDLSYDCKAKSLVLKKASENIWYARGKVFETKYSLDVSDSLIDSLRYMVLAAVLTSSYMGDTTAVLDGTTHLFVVQPFGQIAECCSPNDGTNNAQAVAVMERLCHAVENGKKEDAENLIGEIVRVTNLYRQYYPEGFHRENAFIHKCW